MDAINGGATPLLICPFLLVSRPLLVAHGEDADPVAIETVQGRVAAASKIDHPFSKLGVHVFNWPPDMRLMRKNFNAATDGLHRVASRVGVL